MHNNLKKWYNASMRSLHALDLVIAAVFLALIVGSFFFTAGKGNGNAYAEIKTVDTVYYLPLMENRELTVHGPIGNTTIAVENGAARFTESDCRDKICIAMGEISSPAAWAACLPNKVFLRIIAQQGGGNEVDADVVAY